MTHTGPASDACYNCAAPLSGAYCAACGQKVLPLNPGLHDFLHDFTHEMLHVDGKIVQSVWKLLAAPGFLTREQFEGHRARWMSPIRLYLVCGDPRVAGACAASDLPASDIARPPAGKKNQGRRKVPANRGNRPLARRKDVMLTRRNLIVTLMAAMSSRMASARQQPPAGNPLPRSLPPTTMPPPTHAEIMGSSIFDWTTLPVQKTKVGESRKVCQAPTATLDELECHITTLNPGETPHPPHKHPDEEIVIIKEGTVESLVNGTTRRVGPGSVIFQASNQMHSIRNVGDGPATYHVIKWNSPGMLKK